MSTIKVEVCQVTKVYPHYNADNLELITVLGWQLCTQKGLHKEGDLVVYFEPGISIPKDTAISLGISDYLKEKTDINGNRVLVVSQIKLRGESSFGLVLKATEEMKLGDNVASEFGALKFEPPLKTTVSDSDTDCPIFFKYTSLENIRSYPNILVGEDVCVTEKIHGTNSRVGFIRQDGEVILKAGSKSVMRKMPEDLSSSLYWIPYTLPCVMNLMCYLQTLATDSVVLYGELFGPKIQSYNYGLKSGEIRYRAFDLSLDGDYFPVNSFKSLMDRFEVPTVPVLYTGLFDLNVIKEISDGSSLVEEENIDVSDTKTHGIEGVVVKTTTEKTHPRVGRLALKYIGDGYLFSKAHKNDTTDC